MKHEKVDKKMIVAIISIIIFMISFTIIYMVTNSVSNSITAFEGKIIADEIAREWNESAVFRGVGASLDVNTQGKANYWGYAYYNKMDGNGTDLLSVTVYSNGTSKIEITNLNPPTPTQGIDEWTIDSDEAFSIALQNSEIKSFLNKGGKIDMCYLKGSGSQVSWHIQWAYNTGIDDPKWAQIQIDANTGEVLYVEVDE